MKKIVFTFALQLFACLVYSQAPEFGANPNGQDWKIIKTPAIRIIYPKGMEENAQRVANIINYMDENNTRSIGKIKLKLDMVLQNRTSIPNGYVGLAPARSELYCTPPQSNLLTGSLNWLDVLAIHEYRHVQQNANTKYGLTKFGSIIMGQTAWSGLNVINIPNWFYEGDAVITESALSSSGRGRSAFFTQEQRALAFANKNYKYLKLRNGSFKSLLPDHYRLGYMMLTKAREEKGNDITAKVLRDAASYRGIIYPFSRAMKRNVGYNTTNLYNLAWAENKKKWANELAETSLSQSTPITATPKRTVTDYRFPRFLSDGSIVVNKSSYNKTNAIYKLKDNAENEITTFGISYDENITVGNDVLAWTEVSQDARRSNLNYSDIVLYDTKTSDRKRLTQKSRYFSPIVSPKGTSLAAIHITFEQNNEIHILNPSTGELIKKIANPKNYFLSRLAWVGENQLVSFAKSNNKIAVVKFDLDNNTITELTPWSSHTLEGLSVNNQDVYFNASFTGIDNIFRTDAGGSKAIFQMTSAPIGAFEPEISSDGKTLMYTEFTSMGYKISKTDASPFSSEPYRIDEPVMMGKFFTLANKTEGGDILNKFPSKKYQNRSYNSLFRGMKLHSWNLSPSISTPSLDLNMNNILNDVSLKIGGGINRNEGNKSFYNADLKIGRYFTELDLLGSFKDRSTDFYSSADTIASKTFNELSYGPKIGVPFNWVKGNMTTSLRASVGYIFRSLSGVQAEGRNLDNLNFGSYDLNFSFSSLRRTALQNIGTRLGLSTNVSYTQSTNQDNERIFGEAKVYLPGLGRNHNIVVKGSFQNELLNNPYQYADEFEYPRGFTAPINDQFSMLSVNYSLPLTYPDFGIKGLTYFKRIRTNLFYDAGIAKKASVLQNFSSAGVELIFDNVMGNIIPLSVGLRQSYLLQGGPAGKSSAFSFFISNTI